jgi:hypothetical protein
MKKDEKKREITLSFAGTPSAILSEVALAKSATQQQIPPLWEEKEFMFRSRSTKPRALIRLGRRMQSRLSFCT